MDVELTPDQRAFVQKAIESGRFTREEEAVQEALARRNRWTGEGFIYLPGPGDDRYRRNIGTVLRQGRDGKWHRPSAAWGDAINARLP